MSKFENFSKAMEKIAEAQRLLEKGPSSYYVTEITGAYEYMMERFCPFKVGDTVMLKHAPDPMPTGWVSSAHFLIAGSKAIVHSTECTPKGFLFYIKFDNESWIKRDFASKTEEVVLFEPDRRHTFGFGENSLVKV